jgi:hypothetical protein
MIITCKLRGRRVRVILGRDETVVGVIELNNLVVNLIRIIMMVRSIEVLCMFDKLENPVQNLEGLCNMISSQCHVHDSIIHGISSLISSVSLLGDDIEILFNNIKDSRFK